MTLSTSCRFRILLLSGVFAFSLGVPALAASAGLQRGELGERYPKAPKVLPAPGASSGLLLVDIVLRFPLGGTGLTGAAVVATDSAAFIIRAKALSKHVVLFHDVPVGVHALRFVTAQGGTTLFAFEVPHTPDCTVFVSPGGVSYLGTTTVRKKIGFGPPEVQIAYDAERERESWAIFLKKYPNTPWADLVRARLDSLGGTQAAR